MEEKFVIIIKRYKRENCVLDDMRRISIGNICIVAKNAKHGGLYLNKNARIIKGRFSDPAGSHSSPILIAKTNEVHIEVVGINPELGVTTDQIVKQDIIKIVKK